MRQHTPGPWTVYHDDEGVEIRANDDLMGTIINGKEMDANAQLIEAAPELLAAAQNAITNWDNVVGHTELVEWIETTIQSLKAAILKAGLEG